MLLPGREWQEGYRFGFDGQEKEDEISGNGNINTALFWEFDTRIGRRWNTDPVVDFSISQYATFGNNPIFNIDINGDAWGSSAKRQAKEAAKATGGKAYKAKNQIKGKDNSGVWHVDVAGTPYGDLMKQQALKNYATCGQTLVFKPGENRSEFLREKLGVEFWDAALASESGWEWVKTKLSAGDSWVHSDEGEAFGRNVANMNPGIAATNIASGIESGSDIYGQEMTGWDYIDQGLNAIPTCGTTQGVSVVLNVSRSAKEILALAKKYRLNANSNTTKQLLENWDMLASDWIALYRNGSIKSVLSETGNKTIGEIFSTADSKTRKLILDGRFAK